MSKQYSGSLRDEFVSSDLRAFLAWLSNNETLAGEEAGVAYELAHRRLTLFFASRQCLEPEVLADQTLDIAMRKLPEIPPDIPPFAYLIGIAKNVYRDYLREQQREEQRRQAPSLPTNSSVPVELETRHHCLESCLSELPAEERTLVLAYYREAKQQKIDMRKELAASAGLTLNALRNRIFRLNQRLASCVTNCLAQNAA